MNQLNFLNFIRIRIGEPVTAIDLNASNEWLIVGGVVFGQISGFLGYLRFGQRDHIFVNDIYEEMIRDVGLLIFRYFWTKMTRLMSRLETCTV